MFEQGELKVEKEREFGELRSAIEAAFAADRVAKYLKLLDGRNVRVRNLDAAFAADVLDKIYSKKAGTARGLYESLPVSDQSQIRELYLSKVEDVDPTLRLKFQKLYQYY